MKKYRKTVDGRRVPREPTDRERKDELIPGYEEMTKLSKGIVEKESEAQEKADTFSKKWKEFATGKNLDDKIDNMIDLNDDAMEHLRDRYREITKENPKFSDQLSRFLEPLMTIGNTAAPAETIKEKRKKPSKEQACNRLGYYSFQYFLQQLDVINRSQAGKLHQQNK